MFTMKNPRTSLCTKFVLVVFHFRHIWFTSSKSWHELVDTIQSWKTPQWIFLFPIQQISSVLPIPCDDYSIHRRRVDVAVTFLFPLRFFLVIQSRIF